MVPNFHLLLKVNKRKKVTSTNKLSVKGVSMKKFLLNLIVLIIGISTLYANAPKNPSDIKTEYASDRVIVKFAEPAISSSSFKIGAIDGIASTGLKGVDKVTRDFSVREMKRTHRDLKNKQLEKRLGVSRWYTLKVSEGTSLEKMVEQLKSDPDVEEVTLDYRAYPATVPNDSLYSKQWGHNNTAQLLSYCWGCGGHPYGSAVGTVGFDADAETAWSASQGYGSSSVIIGILDSGVDTGHPDLRLVQGYDFGDDDSDPDDDSAEAGHGTCCAGVAAAIADNGIGVAGIAGGCSVMPLKVADSNGYMYFSYIQDALYYAADNGVDIVSMSLGASLTSHSATDAALEYAYDEGVTLFAATGNENASTISYPAINEHVIAVGAASPDDGRKRSSSSSSEVNSGVNTDPNGYTVDGERWWGSNYGSTTQDGNDAVDIIAPTILPTTDITGSDGYETGDYELWFNGTSCSTPYAAGVAALIKSQNPSWAPSQIRQKIVNTATDVVNVEAGSGWDRYSGYGLINAGAAVSGTTANTPPVADANGPYSGTIYSAVSFSSSGSSDSDGSIASYAWEFGDGSSSSDENPSYTYSTAGTYTVILTVTDDDGDTGSDTTTASITADTTVTNTPPVADANGPYSGTTSSSISFSSSGSSDSDGSIASYAWNFGDGSSSTDENPSYTYTTAGTYTVILTVTDDDGDTGSDTTTASIAADTTNTMISDISMSVSGRRGRYSASSTITVSDGTNSISGAAVSITWSGSYSSTSQGTTDSNGEVTFNTPTIRLRPGERYTFTITINDITKTGYTWDTANSDTTETTTNAHSSNSRVDEITLGNSPNPFNPTTRISYTIVENGNVSLKVFDLTGRLVDELVNEYKSAGYYDIMFKADNLSSGIYFYKLTTNGQTFTRRMYYLK